MFDVKAEIFGRTITTRVLLLPAWAQPRRLLLLRRNLGPSATDIDAGRRGLVRVGVPHGRVAYTALPGRGTKCK